MDVLSPSDSWDTFVEGVGDLATTLPFIVAHTESRLEVTLQLASLALSRRGGLLLLLARFAVVVALDL